MKRNFFHRWNRIVNCFVLFAVILSSMFGGVPAIVKAKDINLPLITHPGKNIAPGNKIGNIPTLNLENSTNSQQQTEVLPHLPMHAPFLPGFGGFWIATGSEYHVNANQYALDLNWGVGSEDNGAIILAVADGVVVKVQKVCTTSGYGCEVVIGHAFGYQTRYAHFKQAPLVKVGDRVTQGTPLGLLGDTGGTSQGNHLHFAVYYCTTFAQNGNYCDSSSLRAIQPNLEGTLVTIANNVIINSANYSVGYEHFVDLKQDPTTFLKHQPMIDIYNKYGGQGWVFGLTKTPVIAWNGFYYQEFDPQLTSSPWSGLKSTIIESNGKANFVIGPIWEKYKIDNGTGGKWGNILSDSYEWVLPGASGYRTDFANGSIIWLNNGQYEYLDSSNANWIGKFFDQPNNFTTPISERKDQYIDFSWPSTSYPNPIQSLNGFSVKYQITEKGFISLSRIYIPQLRGYLKVNVNGRTVLDVSSPNSTQSFESSWTFGLGDQNIEAWYWQEGGKNARLSLSSKGIVPSAFASGGEISSPGEPLPSVVYAGFSPPPFENRLPIVTSDNASFISDLTLPDGTIVSPTQSLTKTWRVKNTGTTTWGTGYQLAFVNGEQMGAPAVTGLPATSPGQNADISVNLTAPNSSGEHTGYFQLRNPQGTYFGPKIYVKINVSAPSSKITILTADPASPANTTKVRLHARADGINNFRAMRILVDGEVKYELGAPDFFYDWNTAGYSSGSHSIIVEVADQTDTSWSRPYRKGTTYTLLGSTASANHQPNPPLPASPYDWYVYYSGNTARLCAQAQGDPDGDTISSYYFEIHDSGQNWNSGWVASNCVDTSSLPAYNYQWHVKVQDNRGAISGWSPDWHFTLVNQNLSITSFDLIPLDGNSENVRLKACVTGQGGVGITIRFLVNSATNGTDSGYWTNVGELGVPCFTDVDAPIWHTLEDNALSGDGQHLVRVQAHGASTGWNGAVSQDKVITLPHRRPSDSRLKAPIPASLNYREAIYLNSRSIPFSWNVSDRASSYRLSVSVSPSPRNDANPVFGQTYPAGTTQATVNFTQDYPVLYWQIEAINDAGSNNSTDQLFGIDQIAPTCSVQTPAPPIYESVFQVNWSGADNLAGISSFAIQYKDSSRSTWEDWLGQVPATKGYELFNGQPGHTYYFRCNATDNAGNAGEFPNNADTFVTIDPSSRPATPWWDRAFTQKRGLTVLNNMPGLALPQGYPIHLRFDSGTTPSAASLYNASATSPKCNDLRIVYNDTTELNRVVKNCSSTLIDIWFRTNVAVPAGASNNNSHQLYYGNASADTPPANANLVWYPYKEADTTNLYFFQEGSGSTTVDSSGNNKNCSIGPSVAWGVGKFGSDIQVSQQSSGGIRALLCGTAAPLNAFTVEFWINTSADYDGRLVGALGGGGNGGAGNNWLINYRGRIHLEVWCPNCGSNGIESNFDLRNAPYRGKWNHVAVTYNGGNQVSFYINGNLDSTKNFPDHNGVNTYSNPLEIGAVESGGHITTALGGLRISSSVKNSFPYGSYAQITNEPSTAAGAVVAPPVIGSPDLSLINLSAYPNPDGGLIIQADVVNQGNLNTQSGFYTDLYLDHLPTGAGDYTGSLQFWVNDPIPAGGSATLTTVITDLSSLGAMAASSTSITETSGTLYAQTDSLGIVTESDDQNNIFSTGLPVCLATGDGLEPDDTYTSASTIVPGESQDHNYNKVGDQDWVRFNAVAGQKYSISTSTLGLSNDTYLYLYGTDGVTLLASNDDNAETLASQIDWVAPASGTYFILVDHWNPNIGGCGTQYTLSVDIVRVAISGNAGVADAVLSYTDGILKTVTSASDGSYSLSVPYGWSGTVTPAKPGYPFIPASIDYTNVTEDQTGQDYLVDVTPPEVDSILLASSNPTAASSVDFSVTFSEPVTGVDADDFNLPAGGLTDSALAGVTGSGASYTVTVNTGTGAGILRMDLVDDNSILDAVGNPLGGPGQQDYRTGQIYTIAARPFGKASPAGGSTDISTIQPLSWNASAGALSYEYCIDQTPNDACDADHWVNAGAVTSLTPPGLLSGTTYSWQVRSVYSSVTTHADDGAWWSFSTLPALGPGTWDDANANWTYASTANNWISMTTSAAYGGGYRYSNRAGSSATILINGPSFSLLYTAYSIGGVYEVFIDDISAGTFGTYSPTTRWKQTWNSPVLADAVHTVRLVHKSGSYVILDGIKVWATPLTIPAAITTLSAVTGSTDGSVDLAWTAVGSDGATGTATGYEVRYSPAAITSEALWNSATIASGAPTPQVAGSSETMSVTGLSPNARYYFAVRAINNAVMGGLSNSPSAIARVTASGSGTYDDAHPFWTYASAANNWIGMTTSAAYNGGYRYSNRAGSSAAFLVNSQRFTLVYTAYSIGGTYEVFIDNVSAGTIDTYSPTTKWKQVWNSPVLSAGVHTVRFVHKSGSYVILDAIKVWAAPFTIPAPITSLAAVTGSTNGTVDLSWTSVGSDGMTGTAASYLVRYSTAPISSETLWNAANTAAGLIPTPALAGSPENMTITGLTPGTNYFFAVRAVNAEPATGGLSNNPSAFAKTATLGPGTWDDSNSAWIYTSPANNWISMTTSAAYNGGYRYSNRAGSSATIFIDGSGFSVIYTAYSIGGVYEVFIDGASADTFETYSSSTKWQQSWDSPALSAGVHTVRLVHKTGSYIILDAIQVK